MNLRLQALLLICVKYRIGQRNNYSNNYLYNYEGSPKPCHIFIKLTSDNKRKKQAGIPVINSPTNPPVITLKFNPETIPPIIPPIIKPSMPPNIIANHQKSLAAKPKSETVLEVKAT